jgi:hypothetical protein
VLAIVAALILGLFVAGVTIAAVDALDIPTCEQVRSGEEPPSEDGDCADTGETANAASNVTGLIGTALGILGTLALFAFGFTGRHPWLRRTLVLIAAALAMFGLTAVITRL